MTAHPDMAEADRQAFLRMVQEGITAGDHAMRRYPQPNYVLIKFAEEAGEVVKAAVHCAEGRDTVDHVRAEMVDAVAMLYRLFVEGDGVIGLLPASWVDPERVKARG